MNFSLIKFKSLKNLLLKIRASALLLTVAYSVLSLIIIYRFYTQGLFDVFSIIVIGISLYFLFNYIVVRNNKYCLVKYRFSDEELNEIEDDIRNSQLYSSRIALSQNYLYSLQSQFFLLYRIPIDDIIWAYFIYTEKNQSRKPYVCIATREKIYKLALTRDVGAVALNLVRLASDEDFLEQLSALNNKILIGNTPENRERYQNKEF